MWQRVAALSPLGLAIFSWSSAGLALIREEKFENKISAAAVWDTPGGICVLVPGGHRLQWAYSAPVVGL